MKIFKRLYDFFFKTYKPVLTCKYFDGQTGECMLKEFVKCNPINCDCIEIKRED